MNAKTDRATAILAGVVAAAGAAVVVVLFVMQSDPAPLWLWGTMAGAFLVLEFSSVEVNDRLFITSSIMVAFAGAVMFPRESVVLAVALMGAVSVLHPSDLRLRRWREPAFNFGQLVVSSTVGVLVLLPFLPEGPVTADALTRLTLGALLAATAYNWVNFRFVVLYARLGYPDQELLPWSRMLGNHALHAVLGAYGALLGASYVMVGPVTLPLMLGTFLVGHVGFASYSRLRRAHEDTVRGFVKAIEALDPYTKGHTERVAKFSRMTGERLGLGADELETLRWAALIHDVGKLAAPTDLVGKEESLTAEEQARLQWREGLVEDLLSRVDFLTEAVREISSGSENRSAIGRVIAAADAFGSMTSARSYRKAVTQEAAFERLRCDAAFYGDEVVEALISAVEASGIRHGSPDPAAAAEVDRLVNERARRA